MSDPRWKFAKGSGRCDGCGAEFRLGMPTLVDGEKTYFEKCAVAVVVSAFLAECYADEGGFGPEERDALRERFPSAASRRLEIEQGNRRLKVGSWIFRSWTGPRFVDGVKYDGPIYVLGSAEVA